MALSPLNMTTTAPYSLPLLPIQLLYLSLQLWKMIPSPAQAKTEDLSEKTIVAIQKNHEVALFHEELMALLEEF